MLAPMSSRSRLTTTLLGALTAVALTGCSVGQPPAYPPQGVDTLQVPTTAPVSADFVARVDHPLAPLAPGETWEYVLADRGGELARVHLAVQGGGEVAGVPVTWVATTVEGGADVADATWRDAWAQDDEGNVWWFAREGEVDGFEVAASGPGAGLVLPAGIRVGDSFVAREQDGRAPAWSRVERTDVRLSTARGELDGLVELTGTAVSGAVDGAEGTEARRWYAPGLGLVLEERVDGRVLRLLRHARPAG